MRRCGHLKYNAHCSMGCPGGQARKLPAPSELALAHFDQYYRPVFHDQWPSIRVALLTQQKYAALVNNFCLSSDDVIMELMALGADDIGTLARNTRPSTSQDPHPISRQWASPDHDETGNSSEVDAGPGSGGVYKDGVNADRADLYDFVPAERVLAEHEALVEQEKEQSVYRPGSVRVHVLPDGTIHIPRLLKVFTFEKGDVTMFEPSRSHGSNPLTGYYLMDAASMLPVIALDLQPDCRVLDLCAAPGGKTLAMIQTGLPGHVTCVDHSFSRLNRLRQILRSYLPPSYMNENRVDVMHGDANLFCRTVHDDLMFDRVLVDVPCFTDRHVLHENHNNIFRRSRIKDRLNIQDIQKSILMSGIQKCRPGGSVVYSTCTLSPPQNDGVIEATLERIKRYSNIDIVIEDLSAMAVRFSDTFVFHKCRFGQLVLPHLTANFGPMYFCKLKRVK